MEKSPPPAQDDRDGQSNNPVSSNPNNDLLYRPGISQGALIRNHVHRVKPVEAKALTGIEEAGIAIPYHNLEGQVVSEPDGKPFVRLRLDSRRGDQKYHQPKGSGAHPYIPLEFPELLEHSKSLTLVEGEFKALALVEADIPAIGLNGLFATVRRDDEGAHELSPEIDALLTKYPNVNSVYLLGDNDTCLNWQFACAAVKLRECLPPRTKLFLPRIPLSEPKGIDDVREVYQDKFQRFWNQIVTEALEANDGVSPDELCLRLLEQEKEHLSGLEGEQQRETLRKLAKAATYMKDPATRAGVVELAKKQLKTTKADFNALVDCEIEKRNNLDQGRDLAPEVQDLIEKHGHPCQYHKENLSINEGFFAGLHEVENFVLWEPIEGKFYKYDGGSGLWIQESVAAIQQDLSNTVLQVGRTCDEPGLEFKRNTQQLSGLQAQLRGIAEKRNPFEHQEMFIHVANGVIRLSEQGEIQGFFRHAPAFYSRNQSPWEFDPHVTCPRFLNELLAPAMSVEDALLLQKYAGLCLLGRNLIQRLVILDGNAETGKSTLEKLICSLVGHQNATELRTAQLTNQFEIHRFIGKTLLFGSDVRQNFLEMKGASVLKALVGGDPLAPEKKNSPEVSTIKGEFCVILTSNSRLRVRLEGDVDAWRRRLLILRFEGKPPTKTIPDFDQVLLREEGPGILNWALVGLQLLLQDFKGNDGRIFLPESQRKRIDDLLSESDSVRHFLIDKVEKLEGEDITVEELFEGYVDYCGGRHWGAISEGNFQKELSDLMPELFQTVRSNSITREGKAKRGFRNVSLHQTRKV